MTAILKILRVNNILFFLTRYDPEGKGYIDHEHFLFMMGKAFAPGDDIGFSKRLVDDSYSTLAAHHQNQMQKQ